MKNIKLVSGIGAWDTRLRSGEDYETASLAELYLTAFNPPSVPKEKGRWIIPSTYHAHDARDHSVQRDRGSFCLLAGDIDQGNHPLEVICDALTELFGDSDRIVYSTRSATEANKKWRYLIPLKYPIAGVNYPDVQALVGNRLRGLDIECDSALNRTGQLVFLPNRNDDFYQFDLQWYGILFDASNYVHIAEFDREDRARDVRSAEAAEIGGYENVPEGDVIKAFNRRFPAQMLMKQYGYKQRGLDFRSPLQQGSTYATRVMENGRWVSLSTSDKEIGYWNGEVTCGDSFDLFRYFDANNDWAAALRIAALQCFGNWK